MLEISLVIQQRYGVKLKADDPQNEAIFASLQSLAAHVAAAQARGAEVHCPTLSRSLLGSGLRRGWRHCACFGSRCSSAARLRAGATPLIERIARHSNPMLPPALCRYTRAAHRRLVRLLRRAAVAAWPRPISPGHGSVMLVWAGTLLLFVGEHWLRPWLFPGESFPGLLQQVRDTWSVWRPRP